MNGFAEHQWFGNTVVAEFARIQTDIRSRAEFLRIQLETCLLAPEVDVAGPVVVVSVGEVGPHVAAAGFLSRKCRLDH